MTETATQDRRLVNRRLAYITERLKEIREESARLRTERDELKGETETQA